MMNEILFSATSPTVTLRITKAQHPQLSFKFEERCCCEIKFQRQKPAISYSILFYF